MKADLGRQIKNYIEWYRYECSDPYDELEWLINCALGNDKEKENIIEVLHITTLNKQ